MIKQARRFLYRDPFQQSQTQMAQIHKKVPPNPDSKQQRIEQQSKDLKDLIASKTQTA